MYVEQLLEFCNVIWNVICNAFSTISYAFTMVIGALGFTNSFTTWLPGILGSAVLVFIAIYVIRFLLLK